MKYVLLIALLTGLTGCRATIVSTIDGSPSRTLATSSEKAVVNLSWAASVPQSKTLLSSAVTYNIYRNGTSIGVTTSTTFQDKTTVPGAGKYTYTIIALDADGNTSAPSNSTVVTR
jgi:hypothetical protein